MTGRLWTQFEQYNSGADCPINSSWTQYNQQVFSDYIYQWLENWYVRYGRLYKVWLSGAGYLIETNPHTELKLNELSFLLGGGHQFFMPPPFSCDTKIMQLFWPKGYSI